MYIYIYTHTHTYTYIYNIYMYIHLLATISPDPTAPPSSHSFGAARPARIVMRLKVSRAKKAFQRELCCVNLKKSLYGCTRHIYIYIHIYIYMCVFTSGENVDAPATIPANNETSKRKIWCVITKFSTPGYSP